MEVRASTSKVVEGQPFTLELRFGWDEAKTLDVVRQLHGLVVFEGGQPNKSRYRKYRIKTVEGMDDFESAIEGLQSGKAVALRVWRDGATSFIAYTPRDTQDD